MSSSRMADKSRAMTTLVTTNNNNLGHTKQCRGM